VQNLAHSGVASAPIRNNVAIIMNEIEALQAAGPGE
jgi:hypothetical protein